MPKSDQSLLAAVAAAILLVFALAGFTRADVRTKLPSEQWDWHTHKWLARGFVGEAGWASKDDHIGIANVLRRRWMQLTKNQPQLKYQFIDVAREYMRGMSKHRSSFTDRTMWVRSLPYQMPSTDAPMAAQLLDLGWAGMSRQIEAPTAWPRKLQWHSYTKKWDDVLALAQDWQDWKYPDKCPEAMHWGSPQGYGHGWEVVDCGDTLNIFYK